MKNKTIRSWLIALCGFLACSGSYISAQEQDKEDIFLTPKEEKMIQNYRLSLLPKGLTELQAGTYEDDSQYFYRIHPDAYYYPVGMTMNDNLILHDGSEWYVEPSQRFIVSKWVKSDLIFIKPKSSCFSNHHYVLHNRVTHDAVEVSFVSSKVDTGVMKLWITGIDFYNRLVYLSNGSAWQINPSEYSFDKWQAGHLLIVGVNNYWRMAKYPHILINTSIYKEPYCEADLAY